MKEHFELQEYLLFFFFNNSNIYYMINIYSDTNQSAIKYLKNTEVNVRNVLVIVSNLNIRDSIWNLLFSFHLIHSNLLVDVAGSFDLMLLYPTNQVLTRYLDNVNDANSVIDLMFLRPNSLEFNNYTIYPELQYLSNHTPLMVNIPIIKEFILDK